MSVAYSSKKKENVQVLHVSQATRWVVLGRTPLRGRRSVRAHSVLCYAVAQGNFSGIYCLLVTATLLDIITPELVEGTASFVASCQTYEGGFSSASQPYYAPPSDLLDSPRPPLGEAHGGYTFCALASWVMLQPFLPSTSQPKINKKSLVRWLVQMQGAPVELGGFKGRTNKLVDGCYSWWVGGSFALLESIGINPAVVAAAPADGRAQEGDWDDIDGMSSARWRCRESQTHLRRFSDEPQGATGVHPLRRSTPRGRTARQASEVRAVSAPDRCPPDLIFQTRGCVSYVVLFSGPVVRPTQSVPFACQAEGAAGLLDR